jgi:peroxiredoxin/SAM-dependent methyltransferase
LTPELAARLASVGVLYPSPVWLGGWAWLAARRLGRPLDAAALFRAPEAALVGLLEPAVEALVDDPGLLGEAWAAHADAAENKRAGRFYTPRAVARQMVGAVAPGDRVVDPACGGGRFLLAALAAGARSGDLVGVDQDPVAIQCCEAAIVLASGAPPGRLIVGDALAALAAERLDDAPPLLPARGFAVVLGNPPYVAGRRAGLPDRYRQAFRVAEYQLDPYPLFVELGLHLRAPGGRLSFIVPNTWMSNHRSGALRQLMLDAHRLRRVVELPEDLFGAGVATVAVELVDGRTPESTWLTDLDGRARGQLLRASGPPSAPLALTRTRGTRALLRAARGWPQTLGDVAEVTRGVNPYHRRTHTPEQIAARVHHADAPQGPHWRPELCGRHLRPYELRWDGRRHLHYGPWLKEPRKPRFFEGPRLLVRKILGETLCAAYLDTPFVCDQSIYVARLRSEQPWPPGALLACLSSTLMAALVRARHHEDDRLFPQLKVGELRSLPLPPVAPDAPEVQALASLALQLQALGGPTVSPAAAALRLDIEGGVRALYAAPFSDPEEDTHMLSEGDRIPPFSLQDDRGATVTDADLSTGKVVLYFYPKDDTPGCTKQACGFRDGVAAYTSYGARVFGVSADTVESHVAFREKFGLNFPLLADVEHALCEAAGVWGEQEWQGHRFQGIARTTFVLSDGVVTAIFPDVSVMGHAERVLAAL